MIEYRSLKAEEIQDSSSKVLYHTPQGNVFAEQFAQQYYSSQGYNSIWSENQFWWQVMALLFWDIIFARVEGAVAIRSDGEECFPEPGDEDFERQFSTFIKMNGMPYDFFSIEFYQRRRSIIDNRFKELQSSNLIDKLSSSYQKHNGQNCRAIEDWNKYSLDNLNSPLGFIPNSVILGICRRLLSDFGYNRAGLPDLIVYRQGNFLFAEVKSKNDKLSQKQKEWHEYLSTVLDQKVEIVLINHTDRQIANLKKATTPKGGKEVKISFGHSSSKKRDEAISFISKQSGYSVEGEGKNVIYSAVFSTTDIETLYTMLDLTTGWKSQCIEIDGQVVKSGVIRNGLHCFREKKQEYASDVWCKQTNYGEGKKNPFDCKCIYFRQLEDNRWDDYGYVDTDKGEWVFDFDKINKELDKQITELQFCPLFDSAKVKKAVLALPERINPIPNTDWAFCGQDYNTWIYHNGKWITHYGEKKEFPGFTVMIGIERITKKDRNRIIRSDKDDGYNYKISLNTGSSKRQTKNSFGCFVATAVYGSYDCIQVVRFRRFRDQHLLRSWIGRQFVKFYYKYGPYLAVCISRSKKFKTLSKVILDYSLKVLKS